MITEQQYKALQSIGCEYTYPDIDKAIRWMREVKGVHVYAITNEGYWGFNAQHISSGKNIAFSHYYYQSCDAAQSAGLDAAIEYVKKEQL